MNIERELEYIRDNEVTKESLNCFRGFTVGIDAELLLRKVTQSNALQSIQDGHGSLDMVVQKQLE